VSGGDSGGSGDAGTVTLADVEAAARRIAGAVERTPSSRSVTLGDLLGLDVVLKHEHLQFTASFKERGAANRLALLVEEHQAAGTAVPGVVAMSAGNHAQAVARHAGRLGIDATIVMPATTPFVKVHRTEVLGARVVLAGADLATATAEARRIAADEGRTLVHPFDDAAVVAGQGTVALELLDDHPELDALVVPVGGGGLIAGMAVAAKARRPDVIVVGVQSDRWPSMLAAVDGHAPPEGGTTVADGIAVPEAGALTSALVAEHVDLLVTVPDAAIEVAINHLVEIEKAVVEGAGAAGLAALLDPPEVLRGRHVGVVLSGGNIDPRLLAGVVMRGLVRSGRLARLRIEVADAPGSLAAVTAVLGAAGANVVELAHDRMLLDVPARSAELEVVIETFDHDHLDRVVAALAEAGFGVARDEDLG
jgi:threonine dehydratase